MSIRENMIKFAMRALGVQSIGDESNRYYNPYYYGNNLTSTTRNQNYGEWQFALAYANVQAVFRSVELIVNQIDRLEYNLYVGHGEDERLIATEHDMGSKFNRALKQHRVVYGRDLFSLITTSTLLYDVTYIELLKNEYGINSGYRWLNPLWVTLQRFNSNYDEFHFQYSGNNETFNLSRDEVAYDFGFNPYDDWQGMSRILPIMDNAEIDTQLKTFTRAFFSNGAFMGGILTPSSSDGIGTPINERDQRILQRQITDMLKGAQHAFKLFIPHKSVQFEQITPPNIDQYYNIHNPISREIFQAFGIPLELAGGDETRFKFGDDVYNAFMQLTIKPIAMRVQSIVNDRLLPFITGSDDVRLIFDTSQFDSATEAHERQTNIVTSQLSAGIITINESRLAIGLAPYEDEYGDMVIINNVPVPRNEVGNLYKYQYGIYDTALDIAQTAPQADSSDFADADVTTLSTRDLARYEHIDFNPTQGMIDEAQRGLDWRSEFGRGGTEVGIARARDIVNGKTLSPDTVKRMASFFARHAKNKQAEGFERGEEGYPSNGRIAWALWGGDAGESWASARIEQMETADESAKKNVTHEHDETCNHDHHEPTYSDDVNKAVDELAQWRRFARKNSKRAFETRTPLLSKYARAIQDDIDSANDSEITTEILHWYEQELKRHDTLPLYKSLLTFRRQFRRWLREAWLDTTNSVWFQIDASETISDEYRRAFRRGWIDAGKPVSAITADDNALWEAQVRKDTAYLNDLFVWVSENSKANGGKWRDVSMRGDNWLSRYDELYAIGFTAGSRGKRLKWSRNPALESCTDCIRLDGRVYYAQKWESYGIRPQSSELACFGIHCGCSLVETDEPVTSGRPPNLRGKG